jgi:hypothetical protein
MLAEREIKPANFGPNGDIVPY